MTRFAKGVHEEQNNYRNRQFDRRAEASPLVSLGGYSRDSEIGMILDLFEIG